jgi:uncharacterized protein YhaN
MIGDTHLNSQGSEEVKIKELQVDGFGVWKGLKVQGLSEDITVFCGQNEAGKTTLMQFIRSMMFGFSPDRLDKYTPPVYGGLAGGTCALVTPTGTYEVQRHVDPNRHSDPIGDLTVIDGHDGTVHGTAKLSSVLSDTDESIFNNVFAIGLREIQELGALNSTAAADYLYRLTSGLDRVSLIDVMRDLKGRREGIWSTNAKQPGRISELSERRTKLLREIDDLKQRSKRWSQLAAETTDIGHQLADVERELAENERQSRLIEIATQIAERWQARRVVDDRIKSFGVLPDRRDVSVEKLDEFNEKLAQQKERIEQVKTQRRQIKKEATALPINRSLWSQKARIEAISEHSPWVESLQRQSDRLKHEIDTIENSLVGEVDGLGHQLKIKNRDVQNLGKRGLSSLESTAETLQEQKDRLTKFQQDLEKGEFDLGQYNERLSSSKSNFGNTDSLEDTGRYVNRLRRRIELEEKIEKLNQSRHALERDIDVVVNNQVLPVGKLSIIGIVFVSGVLFLGFGLLDTLFGGRWLSQTSQQLGIMCLLCGLIAGFISMFLKYHWETMAKEELNDFRHQMDIIRQQLKRARHERDEIERQLPAGSEGQWELDLKDAEGRLTRLEDLAPLENRVQNTRSSIEDLRRRVTNQEREVVKAADLWKASLRTAGLPEMLQPHQLKEITQRSERISDYHARLEQFKSEQIERDKELNALKKRIDAILHESGLTFRTESLPDRLNQITSALNEQRSMVNARKEYISKYKSLRTRLAKAKREHEKLLGQKQRLLAKVGAENEEMYRHFASQHRELRSLRKKRETLSDQISIALGKHFDEAQLRDVFDSFGQTGLEKQWESILERIEGIKEVQTRLHQQRGEYLQEVKMLGEDSRLDTAQLELNAVEAEIKQLKRDWQVLATSTQMLEMIREGYESKRQPETLKEASNYLDRLSEGRYTRIWTRLVGEELLVDNSNDETIPVDKLSRGTREAVYLSLRLALIGAYARRGATIPLVLDDVLVNFDGTRAYAAAELLCEFSRNGYQILMFTCHHHMRDMFHQLGADVRVLPEHQDVVENGAMPTAFGGSNQSASTPVHTVEPTVRFDPAPISTEPVQTGAIPVEYLAPDPELMIDADDYDAELEYELSAVVSDQRTEQRLRHELVYYSPQHDMPMDLSGNEAIWRESNAPVMR